MATYWLILVLLAPDQAPAQSLVGLMINHEVCDFAGASMAAALMAAAPGSTVKWACAPSGERA